MYFERFNKPSPLSSSARPRSSRTCYIKIATSWLKMRQTPLRKVRHVTFERIEARFCHFGVGVGTPRGNVVPFTRSPNHTNHSGSKYPACRMVIPEIDFGAFPGVKGTWGEGEPGFSSFSKDDNNQLPTSRQPLGGITG